MAWSEGQALFAKLPDITCAEATLIVYGPFNRNGRFTRIRNEAFAVRLKTQGAHMGIRNIEAVDALVHEAEFMLQDDLSIPTNNRCRIWQRHDNC